MNTALCHTEGSPRVQVERKRKLFQWCPSTVPYGEFAPSGYLVAAAPGPGRTELPRYKIVVLTQKRYNSLGRLIDSSGATYEGDIVDIEFHVDQVALTASSYFAREGDVIGRQKVLILERLIGLMARSVSKKTGCLKEFVVSGLAHTLHPSLQTKAKLLFSKTTLLYPHGFFTVEARTQSICQPDGCRRLLPSTTQNYC